MTGNAKAAGSSTTKRGWTTLVDNTTTCCGFAFGPMHIQFGLANFCPCCGKKILNSPPKNIGFVQDY